jgi:hypothetical protein
MPIPQPSNISVSTSTQWRAETALHRGWLGLDVTSFTQMIVNIFSANERGDFSQAHLMSSKLGSGGTAESFAGFCSA